MSAVRMAAVYAAAALLVSALFIFLHHLGNRIDYRTAAQRLAAEMETDLPDEGFAAGFKTGFDHCKLSVIVLAGAQTGEPGGNALRDALLLRELVPMSQHYDFCDELRAAVNGAVLYEQFTSPYYWWGSTAVYAILLHRLSVADMRASIRFGSYAGWIALAIALLWLAPRALVVVAPLIVFGCFFSGIRYFSDIPDGVPYLWTVWAAVTLVVLLRVRLPLARLFCFIAGMVLWYLYLSMGPFILMVVLIGMLVGFGRGHRGEAARSARHAGRCIALCAAGFAASFALGLGAKVALEACLVPHWFGLRAVCEGLPTDRFVWRIFSDKAVYQLVRAVLEAAAGLRAALQDIPALARFAELLPAPGSGGTLQATVAPWLHPRIEPLTERAGVPIVQHFEPYWQVGLGSAAAGRILTWTAAGSLAAAVAVAVVQARRRRPAALGRIGWMAALMALAVLLFLEPNDESPRFARFLFVLYALAFGALAAAVMETAAAERAVNDEVRVNGFDAGDASVP